MFRFNVAQFRCMAHIINCCKLVALLLRCNCWSGPWSSVQTRNKAHENESRYSDLSRNASGWNARVPRECWWRKRTKNILLAQISFALSQYIDWIENQKRVSSKSFSLGSTAFAKCFPSAPVGNSLFPFACDYSLSLSNTRTHPLKHMQACVWLLAYDLFASVACMHPQLSIFLLRFNGC